VSRESQVIRVFFTHARLVSQIRSSTLDPRFDHCENVGPNADRRSRYWRDEQLVLGCQEECGSLVGTGRKGCLVDLWKAVRGGWGEVGLYSAFVVIICKLIRRCGEIRTAIDSWPSSGGSFGNIWFESLENVWLLSDMLLERG
jgi:hypothetical protein